MEIDYKDRMSSYQLWQISAILAFMCVTIFLVTFNEISSIYLNHELKNQIDGDVILDAEGKEEMKLFKQIAGITVFSVVILLFINPINMMYRQARYSLFFIFGQILIAPFGMVKFKMYLLAEILSESVIQLEDFGKCIAYIVTNRWNLEFANMS